MRAMIFAASILFAVPSALAQPIFEVEPSLVSEEMRSFEFRAGPEAEQTVEVHKAGSDLVVRYSSDTPIEMKVSFPLEEKDGSLTFNPLHSLIVRNIQPLQNAAISIDLTRSPAWSPSRTFYLLQVGGSVGGEVLIHDIQMAKALLPRVLQAALSHLFLDEPVLLSSVNYLWGYRMLDLSVSLLLGIVFLLSVFGLYLSQKGKGKFLGLLPLLCIVFLLLYDARFSLDLLRVSAKDIQEWRHSHQYRQIGSLVPIADLLHEESKSFPGEMKIAMCFDGNDFVLKQLRYLSYPLPVGRVEEGGEEATHLVLIDTDRGRAEEGIVSCGEEFSRPADVLQLFEDGSVVTRFTQ